MELGPAGWPNSLFAARHSLFALAFPIRYFAIHYSPFAAYEEEGFPFFAGLATTYSPMSLRQSTIGAKAFDGRVRDGIGSFHLARATRPARNGNRKSEVQAERKSEDASSFCPPSSDV